MEFSKETKERREKEIQAKKEGRLPPGQSLTIKWPVLHYAGVPKFDPAKWDFKIYGLVEEPVRWNYQQFMALPRVQIKSDIHCVTRWSKLDNVWEGVAFKEVMKHVRLKPEANFVMFHDEQGYTANVPLADLMRDDVLFADKNNGENISPDHGWPLRLVVPHLYFWKSIKWVRAMEFLSQDKPGFWERNGYHIYGDPWKEERYTDD
ncbi:MAG: sulfite oxidase-like oxidoreductase [Acidobacteria bacterium]|nr:MAG: sulfite oxidase-like oxidoreductase [Acidobacteriota bacterium]